MESSWLFSSSGMAARSSGGLGAASEACSGSRQAPGRSSDARSAPAEALGGPSRRSGGSSRPCGRPSQALASTAAGFGGFSRSRRSASSPPPLKEIRPQALPVSAKSLFALGRGSGLGRNQSAAVRHRPRAGRHLPGAAHRLMEGTPGRGAALPSRTERTASGHDQGGQRQPGEESPLTVAHRTASCASLCHSGGKVVWD